VLFNIEISDEYIAVNVKAPPVDGKANKAIIDYFADVFGTSKRDVCLEKGQTNKNKIISLKDCEMNDDEIYEFLKNNMI
jgi:uncharacterized protein (TIGR00251 family)